MSSLHNCAPFHVFGFPTINFRVSDARGPASHSDDRSLGNPTALVRENFREIPGGDGFAGLQPGTRP